MLRPRIDDINEKVVLITGGSRGIGLALANGFAAAGADVVIASRKLENCESVAAEIRQRTGRRALAVRCDVGSWDDVERLADHVHDAFGRCDVLVNNAGMTPAYPDLSSITEAYYDKVMQVNLKGPFRLAVLVGTRMSEGNGGSIINISSGGSIRPGARQLVYCAAKAGLNAVTLGLAEALGPSVRVNALLPGPVQTDLSKGWTEAQRKSIAKSAPLDRLGQPEDFIGPALWLASEASAYVTGVLIQVDGGLYRQM
jgi:NAD(P)-dependent dehydrogenase (short-subunit alcohol dehydrogenase family)